uniref:Uncharacterized protein n=1 Tax=viral metagenome TaxID=1070528 RepID=A0A6C0BYN0_9ZZZZ
MEGARSAEKNRMLQLANSPHTEVLEYAYETPQRDADAIMCVKLATLAVEARRGLPSDLSVVIAARKICKENPTLKQFSRTHPQTFMAMMDMEKCGQALEMLQRLARLRQHVDEGMSEAEANVHANRIIMENTMRNPTEEEKQTLDVPTQC